MNKGGIFAMAEVRSLLRVSFLGNFSNFHRNLPSMWAYPPYV